MNLVVGRTTLFFAVSGHCESHPCWADAYCGKLCLLRFSSWRAWSLQFVADMARREDTMASFALKNRSEQKFIYASRHCPI